MQSARSTVNKVILQSARKPLILQGKKHFARSLGVHGANQFANCTVQMYKPCKVLNTQ